MMLCRKTFSLLALLTLVEQQFRSGTNTSFTLKIPDLQLTVPGESTGFLTRTDFNTFQIEIRPAPVSYGSIRSKINTESAGIIMDTRTVGDAVVCSFDLNRRAGFRFNEGRNSVEIEARDSRGRVTYSSFLLDTSRPAVVARHPPSTAAPENIRGIEKYAVVIGVNSYKDPAIHKLEFAVRDAESIRDFLLSGEGGGFRSENVRYLVNENASLYNLQTALRTFLAKPGEEDLVVIYFAGHGTPDYVNAPGALYLLPYDTERDNYGATAFPMEELQDVFNRIIKARRIVTFTDACHSGGVSGESMADSWFGRAVTGRARGLLLEPVRAQLANNLIPRNVLRYAVGGQRTVLAASDFSEPSPADQRGVQLIQRHNLINQYMTHYAGKGQRAVLTASNISESSHEDAKWGGGHGVFTYFLLEGLKGKADRNHDGTVTAGELFDYVMEQVPAAEPEQHPTAGAGLARDLPLSGKALH